MRFTTVVETSNAVAATSSRKEKVALLAECLAALPEAETRAGVGFLAGEPRQRPLGVGWAALRELPPAAADASLEVMEVDAAFDHLAALSGSGSAAARRAAVDELFGRATEAEQAFLRALITGEVRQGALRAVAADAIAAAFGMKQADVRRALMLLGDPGEVAAIAREQGAEGLVEVELQVGRPVLPMLAGTAPDLAGALAKILPAAVEWKLDGARIQVHRSGDEVGVYTRSLDDVTSRVPEIVEGVLALPVSSIVLDGEAIVLREDGRPHPFQVTASRFGRRAPTDELRRELPLTPLYFDVLHLDGRHLLDLSGSERAELMAGALPEELRVPRIVTADPAQAEAFQRDALDRGHEGVLVKALDVPYEAGRRGAGWIKVKPRHTLDLVILAAEWGHGRRRGKLSNLHLGARDGDGFVMLGKTFKGLTDEMLAWQTEKLLALETGREGIAVHVRPELVAEIAFDGVQQSSRYPGGVTLRFARVLRYRDDKRADEADTLEMVRSLGPG
jgi:DNA ligase-1